jgi:hypothetical protein
MRGTYFAVSVFCRTTVANSSRLEIYDGVGSSYSAYHDGTTPGTNNGYQLLTVVRQLDAAATQLVVKLHQELSGSSYWSGACGQRGSVAPSRYFPCPIAVVPYFIVLAGTQTVSTNKARLIFTRPGIVKWVQLLIVTVPTGSAFIVDANSHDGTSDVSMYSTRPQLADGGRMGGAAPDGTYERRCLNSSHQSSAPSNGQRFSLDVDQIGSSVAGADLLVRVDVEHYDRPQEQWLPYDQVD